MNKQTDYTPWALAIHELNLKGTGKIPKNQLDLFKKNNSMQIPLINKNTFFFLEKRVIFITGTDEHGKKNSTSADPSGRNPKEHYYTIAKFKQDTICDGTCYSRRHHHFTIL